MMNNLIIKGKKNIKKNCEKKKKPVDVAIAML